MTTQKQSNMEIETYLQQDGTYRSFYTKIPRLIAFSEYSIYDAERSLEQALILIVEQRLDDPTLIGSGF